ncbi:MAG: hypothetical protein LUD52_07455, partial [Opitutae bacterium]|nr:hypothetical protein [Opitutae bacterium]
ATNPATTNPPPPTSTTNPSATIARNFLARACGKDKVSAFSFGILATRPNLYAIRQQANFPAQ